MTHPIDIKIPQGVIRMEVNEKGEVVISGDYTSVAVCEKIQYRNGVVVRTDEGDDLAGMVISREAFGPNMTVRPHRRRSHLLARGPRMCMFFDSNGITGDGPGFRVIGFGTCREVSVRPSGLHEMLLYESSLEGSDEEAA